jgi:signal transduction histidine kinase
VNKIAAEEKLKVKSWAEAIVKKAELVNYTNTLFNTISEEERKRVEIWAEANRRVVTSGVQDDLSFYTQILFSNTTIPIILTDKNGKIVSHRNFSETISKDTALMNIELRELQKQNTPIEIAYYKNELNYLYFKESTIFSELRNVLQNQINSLNDDIIINSASVPVIYTDSSHAAVIAFGNIDSTQSKDTAYISQQINEMELQNKPIVIDIGNGDINYIYYADSHLLKQLKIYPFIQIGIIALFLLIAYYLFSTARNVEQNQVWVGMAKETAHQLGTPLSSLLAWLEVLKMKNVDAKTIEEMGSDVQRLETITERFSKIGSVPSLQQEDINQVIQHSLDYFRARISKKVQFSYQTSDKDEVIASVNVPLFEWVLENIIKNAVDAMDGDGNIDIQVIDQTQYVYIDITDNGKGMAKSKKKTIFEPGFTTKKRGWGLGLSLTKRIVENYHAGKIFVKSTEIDKGTTFRIVLNKLTDQNGRNLHSRSFL